MSLEWLGVSKQDVFQEFSVETVKHELGISNNKAERFGDLCMSSFSP